MDDLISRQAAIDVMLMALDDDWESDYATDRMKDLPSAQSEVAKDTNVPSNDCISRQSAIDAIRQVTIHAEDESLAVEALENLPSAQPEIIHCEDCKHCQREDYDVWISKEVYDTRTSFWCSKLRDVDQKEQIEVMLDDYCSWAERRKDG